MLFLGHGSPENGIDNNDFTQAWRQLGSTLARPKAIISISAHWLTEGTYVQSSTHPRTIYDFYGFEEALYQLTYPAPGSPEIADRVQHLVPAINSDTSWGLDHGTWIPLLHLYPAHDIPVFQLSLDYTKSYAEHYALGERLSALRKEGILLMGSGNIVHNLRTIDPRPDHIYAWSKNSDELLSQLILKGDHELLMDPLPLHKDLSMAIPTPEHYWPLLYILGAQHPQDCLSFFAEGIVHGSISMRGVLLQ